MIKIVEISIVGAFDIESGKIIDTVDINDNYYITNNTCFLLHT